MLATKSDLKKFGQELAKARRAANLSQTQLAEKVGCSCKQINHIEYGENWPSLQVYIPICRVLGLEKIPLVI